MLLAVCRQHEVYCAAVEETKSPSFFFIDLEEREKTFVLILITFSHGSMPAESYPAISSNRIWHMNVSSSPSLLQGHSNASGRSGNPHQWLCPVRSSVVNPFPFPVAIPDSMEVLIFIMLKKSYCHLAVSAVKVKGKALAVVQKKERAAVLGTLMDRA